MIMNNMKSIFSPTKHPVKDPVKDPVKEELPKSPPYVIPNNIIQLMIKIALTNGNLKLLEKYYSNDIEKGELFDFSYIPQKSINVEIISFFIKRTSVGNLIKLLKIVSSMDNNAFCFKPLYEHVKKALTLQDIEYIITSNSKIDRVTLYELLDMINGKLDERSASFVLKDFVRLSPTTMQDIEKIKLISGGASSDFYEQLILFPEKIIEYFIKIYQNFSFVRFMMSCIDKKKDKLINFVMTNYLNKMIENDSCISAVISYNYEQVLKIPIEKLKNISQAVISYAGNNHLSIIDKIRDNISGEAVFKTAIELEIPTDKYIIYSRFIEKNYDLWLAFTIHMVHDASYKNHTKIEQNMLQIIANNINASDLTYIDASIREDVRKLMPKK